MTKASTFELVAQQLAVSDLQILHIPERCPTPRTAWRFASRLLWLLPSERFFRARNHTHDEINHSRHATAIRSFRSPAVKNPGLSPRGELPSRRNTARERLSQRLLYSAWRFRQNCALAACGRSSRRSRGHGGLVRPPPSRCCRCGCPSGPVDGIAQQHGNSHRSDAAWYLAC